MLQGQSDTNRSLLGSCPVFHRTHIPTFWSQYTIALTFHRCLKIALFSHISQFITV